LEMRWDLRCRRGGFYDILTFCVLASWRRSIRFLNESMRVLRTTSMLLYRDPDLAMTTKCYAISRPNRTNPVGLLDKDPVLSMWIQMASQILSNWPT
jgi:hypothetical protein